MKIGFIGGFGHHYLRALLPAGESPVSIEAAVASDGFDREAARQWARGQNISVWFDRPVALFEQFQPDAVSIGSIYGRNGELVATALSRGIPVVSDKPIAATWEQFGVLKDLVKYGPQILLTEFDMRSRPAFRAAQAAIAAGEIGEVILATGQKSYRFGTRPAWYGDRASYGGTLLWIASHAIDAIGWVSGRKIRRVIGRGGNLSHPELAAMDDHVSVLMELDNGGSGIAHADFLRPAAAATHGDDRLRIAGATGLIEIISDRCRLTTRERGEVDITDRVTPRAIHLELLAALRGEGSEWFSTGQSMETAELLLHCRDAADSGEWVEIPPLRGGG